MRDQIIAALREAQANRHIGAASDIGAVADTIVRHLSVAPATAAAPVGAVLPEATHVTVMDAPTMVAFIASNAAADAPADEQASTREFAADADYRQTRHLMWALQDVFGVRVNTHKDTRTVRIGGRASDISAFRLVTNALIASGRAETESLIAGESNIFWATLGNLVANTDRAREQAEAAADRAAAAKQALVDVYGIPNTVARAAVAANGSPVYEAVTRTLATTALPSA